MTPNTVSQNENVELTQKEEAHEKSFEMASVVGETDLANNVNELECEKEKTRSQEEVQLTNDNQEKMKKENKL